MSTTRQRQQQHGETYQCNWCERDAPSYALVKGSFCSRDCFEAHRADKQAKDILNTLQHTHVWCGSCFRRLKHIEKPKPEADFDHYGHGYLPVGDDSQTSEFFDQSETFQAAVGIQHTTENAVHTEKTVRMDEHGRETLVGTGVGCRCGATVHNQVSSELRDRFRVEYAYHLSEAILELEDEDKLSDDVGVDHEVLLMRAVEGLPFQVALRSAILAYEH